MGTELDIVKWTWRWPRRKEEAEGTRGFEGLRGREGESHG